MLNPSQEGALIEPADGGGKNDPATREPVGGLRSPHARLEKIKAYQKAWREKNKEKMKEYVRAWKERNPDKQRQYRKKNKNADFRLRMDLLAFQKGACSLCGESLHKERHLDHIVPVCQGGASVIDNYQYLCPTCNMANGALTNDQFVEHIGKILKHLGK